MFNITAVLPGLIPLRAMVKIMGQHNQRNFQLDDEFWKKMESILASRWEMGGHVETDVESPSKDTGRWKNLWGLWERRSSYSIWIKCFKNKQRRHILTNTHGKCSNGVLPPSGLECHWNAYSQGVMLNFLLDDVFGFYLLIPEKIVWHFKDHIPTFWLCGGEGK